MNQLRRILAALLIVLVTSPSYGQVATSTQMTITYQLKTDQKSTSLAVKAADGSIVRTIFSGKPQNAGSYTLVWDGLTDSGAAATGGPFTPTLLYSNWKPIWEGTIGNTTSSFTGYNRWETFGGIGYSKFTFVNGTIWSTQNGSEGSMAIALVPTTDPNTPTGINGLYPIPGIQNGMLNQNIELTDIANDGSRVYLMNHSAWSGVSYVTVFDATSATPAGFTTGTYFDGGGVSGNANCCAWNGTQLSGIDYNPVTADHPPTAIAVQRGGTILAVAHGNYVDSGGTPQTNNVVKFFNKTSGATAGSNLTITNPQTLAFSSAGLWVLGSGVVSLVTSVGALNTIAHPITGLSNPQGMDVNPVNNHIYILDAGTSQQLKEYDTAYTLVRTYGVAGGYTDCNPTIAHNRFMFDLSAITGTTAVTAIPPWVRVDDNGDAWVMDNLDGFSGTFRMQHLTPSGGTFSYVNQVIGTKYGYTLGTSHTQPGRVFQGFLELAVDYTVPNLPGDPTAAGGNNSWALVRDWAVGAQGACGSTNHNLLSGPFNVLRDPELLSNGRVYAHINDSTGYYPLVELPTSGTAPMRYIGPGSTPQYESWPQDRNGTLRYWSATYVGAGSNTTVLSRAVTGFDGSNNPTYGSPTTWQSINYNSTTQPAVQRSWGGNNTNMTPTTGGTVGVFDLNPKGLGLPHLGGIVQGRTSFFFTTQAEADMFFPLGNNTFPHTDSFGSHNGIGVNGEGRYLITTYDGQSASYGPQYNLYYEDGLFIGAFGPFGSVYLANTPGRGENIAWGNDVTVAGELYHYISVESPAIPIQRWHLSNLQSVHEISGTGALGTSVSLTTVNF